MLSGPSALYLLAPGYEVFLGDVVDFGEFQSSKPMQVESYYLSDVMVTLPELILLQANSAH